MMASGRRAVFTVGFIPSETPQWQASGPAYGWTPRADICETPEAFHYEIEVPGTSQENLKLHFEDGQLIIEGIRAAPDLPAPRRCLQVEIEHGRFRRALPVPSDADTARIEAHYNSGILTVTVPRTKPKAAQNLKIDVM